MAQRLRIACGLMLFAFATTHFLNHALGLVDLKTTHEVEAWRKIVTRSVPGTIVLSGALATHTALTPLLAASGHGHPRGVDAAGSHRLRRGGPAGVPVDLTVVGSAVNVASRLETVAKQKGFQIVMSADVVGHAGCLEDAGPVLIINVRGMEAPMEVIGIMRGCDLPASILAAAAAEGPKTTAQRLKHQEPAANP